MTIEQELIFLALLLFLSAFSSMAEAALLSLSKFKVKHWVAKKHFGAMYVKKLKDNPERLLSTTLILNNLVNTAAAAVITEITLSIFQDNAIGIAIGVGTILILIVGDIIPKSIATNHNELFAPIVAPMIWQLSVFMYPLIWLLDIFLKAVNLMFGRSKGQSISKEELKYIVQASQEEGSIRDIEKKLIQRVFEFGNTTVGDVMTRKKTMIMVGSDMKIKDVLQLPNIKIYSRLPVYEKTKDSIVGILYLKDILSYARDNKFDASVKEIMRKPFFVFESKKVDSMLRLFQLRKEHMAIVINNKGQVVGLVTIENILEEIVGEIIDESDRINPTILQISKTEWLAKGTVEIADLNAKTGMAVKESDFDNLDTFILAELGRAPKLGDEIPYQNYKLLLEDVQGKKVLNARILKVS